LSAATSQPSDKTQPEKLCVAYCGDFSVAVMCC